MTIEMFTRLFPYIAVNLTVGVITTVQHNDKAYSFKKIAPGKFEPYL